MSIKRIIINIWKLNAKNYLLRFVWIIVQNFLWLLACPVQCTYEMAKNALMKWPKSYPELKILNWKKKMKFKTILRLRQTHTLEFVSNIFKELPGADHKIKGNVKSGRIWSDDPRLAMQCYNKGVGRICNWLWFDANKFSFS